MELTYKWAKHGHQNKSRHWIVTRYFGRFNKSRQDRWVSGNRDTGAHLRKFSWTKIARHQMVAGTSSPDDPSLTEYWSERRRKGPSPPLDAFSLRMLKIQSGRCPLCGAVNAARPVLRGPRRSNTPGLPGRSSIDGGREWRESAPASAGKFALGEAQHRLIALQQPQVLRRPHQPTVPVPERRGKSPGLPSRLEQPPNG